MLKFSKFYKIISGISEDYYFMMIKKRTFSHGLQTLVNVHILAEQ
jgi:hypothetical protein